MVMERLSTHTSRARRVSAALAATAAVTIALIPSSADAAPPRATGTAYTFAGTQVFPEGLDTDGRYVYSTSFADGTVYRGAAGGSTMRPFLPAGADGRTSAAGIRLSGDRLLVAGGMTGRFFVYTTSGRLVSSYVVPDAAGTPTLVNDAAIAPNGDAYITDSYRPVVYRIPAAQIQGRPGAGVRTLTAAYDLPDYLAGQSNGNGIVATPDGRSLIVGYYESGALNKVDLRTGRVSPLALRAPLTSADGMLLFGHTLVVARAATNEIDTLRLDSDYTRGTVTAVNTYPGVDTPTGIAVSRGRLLVTNSQLDTLFFGAPQTSTTFTLGSIPFGRVIARSS